MPSLFSSPSQGLCCSQECSFKSEAQACDEETDCQMASICSGLSPVCPDPRPKENLTLCSQGTRVCLNGVRPKNKFIFYTDDPSRTHRTATAKSAWLSVWEETFWTDHTPGQSVLTEREKQFTNWAQLRERFFKMIHVKQNMQTESWHTRKIIHYALFCKKWSN